jgi:flagellar basal body rod protein FlgB
LTEILSYIINFTQARQKILIKNINSADDPKFVPQDLPVNRFAELLNIALDEHLTEQRLLLCDTNEIMFKENGAFEIKSSIDHNALSMLRKDKNKYIEMQIEKLLENTLNQRFAAETLSQKQIFTN